MRHLTRTKKRWRSVFLHATLILGSFVFSIPFIWLISTSCKVPDEMYPPRWIPEVPEGVVTSPYIRIRQNERPVKPPNVTLGNWERLRGPILESLSEVAAERQAHLPTFYGPYLGAPDVAEGLFGSLVKRVPDALFEQSEAEARAWFVSRVDDALLHRVFEMVYRRAAVSDVALHGWNVRTVERPTASKTYPWEVVDGTADLVWRDEGLLRPAKEVHYSFEERGAFSLQIVLPLEMAPQDLKKLVVSVHGDRSWHEVWPTVELAGRRYQAANPAFLSSDLWQDITWQVRSDADKAIEMKTWIPLDEAGASDFHVANQVRITLRFKRATRPVAAFHKYANNYRDVLRRVPLLRYVRNSLLLVVLNVAGQIIGSSLVAFSFARLRWPARDFCFVLVLATLMIPPQVTMIPVFLIFKHLGWYNTLRPLWLPAFFGSAFYIFLLRQFMRGIPSDLEDSAKIDGCGYVGIYWRIILPLIKPALAAIGIFTFMGTWNDFMGPLIYLSDQELYPLSLGLFALQAFQGGNFGLMMAASVLMTLPVILLFFAAQRHFIQGVTLTGLKG